jgi:hypothetical protein
MCKCLCPIIGIAHQCTGEESVLLTITGAEYVPDGNQIYICAACADAWQTAKPHRVIERQVSLDPVLTTDGRRA